MKRILITGLLLIAGASAANCDTTFFPPLQSANQNDSMQNYSSNLTSAPDPFAKSPDLNNISQIEQSLFGKSYENQNISTRLSRIEKSLFTTTYSNAPSSQRIDNIISNFNQINKNPNISQAGLSKMESQIFSQKFPQANPQRRVERLEQQVFGTVQSGDMNSRYEALKMATRNYNRNLTNAYNPNNVVQSGWKGIAGNFGNPFFGGSMTGFTPPINPYYGNGFNNFNSFSNPLSGGYGRYRGNYTNRGLNGFSSNDSYSGYGSGTGVTILD